MVLSDINNSQDTWFIVVGGVILHSKTKKQYHMTNKLLLNTSLEEFIEALRTGLGLSLLEEDEPHTDCSPQKHFIYGMKGLAQLLGCSLSTANRIKKSGVLNAAIVQRGKIIVIDADLALDLLRTHNRRKYNK